MFSIHLYTITLTLLSCLTHGSFSFTLSSPLFFSLSFGAIWFQGENFMSVEKNEIQVEIGGGVCEISRIEATKV